MTRLRHALPPLLALPLLLALGACRSTAPNTMSAVAINAALAAAVTGVSVANGGCVATCTQGWTCNPKTGLCEAPVEFKCVGGDLSSGLCSNRPEDLSAARAAQPASYALPGGLGISPATGTTPPPPAEASPRPPTISP
jgi:hypothetical protein